MKKVFYAGLMIVFSATSVFAADYLTKADFGSKIVGKTLSSKTQKGKTFTLKFTSGGGSMKIKGLDASDVTWSFSGDTVCWVAYKYKECDKVEMKGANKANFVDASTGKVNNSYSIK